LPYPTPARVPPTPAARLAPLLLLLLFPAAAPAEAPADLAALRQNALRCERDGRWQDACQWYDEILRKDRASAEARRGYQRCLRRLHLARRHADTSYRDSLARLDVKQALDVYEQVLTAVAAVYVDRRKTTHTALFRHGLQELRFALQEKAFLAAYLPGVSPGSPALKEFEARLAEWPTVKLAGPAEAREQVLAVVAAAREAGLQPGRDLIKAFGLEFAAGACNALDEHTLFLTPGRYGDAQAALSGRLVSVGVELVAVDGHLEISRVYPRSPAQEAGLQKHDRLVQVDGRNVERESPENVADLLRGAPGSRVRLTVLPADRPMMGPSRVTLDRRPVVIPSVEYSLGTVTSPTSGELVPVGVVRVSSFQETTPQEVREAIAVLRTGTMTTPGMRGMILDLRGNPGGLFKSAVEVAELFLHEGVIAVTHSHFPDYNQAHRARSMHPLMLPMVVLIDADTASAAEVVAAALKDQRRATLLVGQTTFGKGTIQCLVALDKVPLDKMPAGIRITVARFCTPADQPITGRGISPNITLEGKDVMERAQALLLGLLGDPMPMPMPMAPGGMAPMPMPVAGVGPMSSP
jgi:carboxyl-terminal processing protease